MFSEIVYVNFLVLNIFTGKKDILFMGNHGVLSVANTISIAFDHLYYLERASQLQASINLK